ncbi:TetR/AcrR family transcriptional regulator [Bosea sp. 117]|uniref:TetR/AcrR family transcriptional regulator n=1 Tax=Bosea sp. 117 TaxID=1125973 RepID=UPI000690EFBB|nr:TetR/AcrR family transcriptional regulator [Bosea sp. 117]
MSAAAPKARRGRDGAETRARIEQEALRLFAEKGVDGTSVRDIAQAVGVAEGALYRHFASKEALARDIFLARYAELAAAIGAITAQVPDLAGRVRALVAHACALFDAEPALFAYLLVTQHDHLTAVAADPSANVAEAIAAMMREAMEKGELPAQDVSLAAALALGAVVQPAVFVLYGRLPAPLAAYAGRIAEAVLAALGARDVTAAGCAGTE